MDSKDGIWELDLRDEICQAGLRLYSKNFLASCDGNISFRISDDRILITPTGVSKSTLKAEDLAVVNLQGEVLEGRPSSEVKMHLAVYRNCPLSKAVVHAHPPHAIAWTVGRPELKFLPSDCLSEVILATGDIPIVSYARPGTEEMGTHLLEFLPTYRALILARHGALTWGESLSEGVNGMERIDHSAQILLLASQLGPLAPLPAEEVTYLRKLRKQIGEKLL